MGDAVWELFIREMTITQTENPKELHAITIKKVNAEFQHMLLDKISDFLTEEEQEIARRARNLTVPTSRRNNQADYRMATAFEALIGYWHDTDKNRLIYILEVIKKDFLT